MKADKENEKTLQTGKMLAEILFYVITVETLDIWLVKNNLLKMTAAAIIKRKRTKQLWALKWKTK